ncbi:MAG TPA: hypothetical protein PLT82_02990 [Candidatus Hydrogenedens sp.]|nr:hypothetical protein [Candidatus Hydrogenedens sp.]HOK09390.1 hypothetical protein [Candidatus Hydrogenedens sp.]HOL19103.1 hypothetical protein [Candidatus Hydrogenedens sp.]HPP58079.1 hypothetical protein [Candidatus Hydrogenedens sp.]
MRPKTVLFIMAIPSCFLLLFSGCGVELLTTTAIQGELQAQQLKSMQKQVQGIANQTGKINLERAIQTFQAENGRYPKSLDELVPQYLPSLPQPSGDSLYSFDPSTGQIITVPAGIEPADLRKLEQIKFAVLQYAYTTGYYPTNLDMLYPTYLSFLPKTSSGEAFVYNPQTGAVMHPKQTSGMPNTIPSGNPVPINSPVSPVTGGIAIQQQLNGMTNSSGAVGSYSRQSVQNIQNDYSNKQNKVMDDLGL